MPPAWCPSRRAPWLRCGKGFFRLYFASGSLTLLEPSPFDPTLFRFNEGACDNAGRFWVGVLSPEQRRRERLAAVPLVCERGIARPRMHR